MRVVKLITFAAAIIFSASAMSFGQVIIQVKPDTPQPATPGDNYEDDQLIRPVFDPITDDLKLTSTQRLRTSQL